MFGTSVEDWRDETFHLEGSDYVSESILTSNAQQVKDLTKLRLHMKVMLWHLSSDA